MDFAQTPYAKYKRGADDRADAKRIKPDGGRRIEIQEYHPEIPDQVTPQGDIAGAQSCQISSHRLCRWGANDAQF